MKIHFIGIGGIGMSALAAIAKKNGNEVRGSDKQEGEQTIELKKLKIPIQIGHRKDNLKPDTDLVIFTSAITDDNPELKEAKKRKIEILERSEYLGKLMEDKKGIAIAGTHGKTTISSMISVILLRANLDPTVIVGGLIPELGRRNWRNGKGEYMVVEACEYHSAFLKLKPFITVISNIEEEHLDYFKDINDINENFEKFLRLTSKNGFAVINGDNVNTQKLIENDDELKIYTYGAEGGLAEWKALNIKEEPSKTSFEVYKNEQKIDEFDLGVPGRHSVFNALAAIITTAELGVGLGTIKDALNAFKGAVRRMELKGEKEGVLVIDDYAHHPTEIKTTLEAIQNFYSDRNKIWCVFQPHQYSRTKHLFSGFLEAFDIPDEIIVTNIYQVRDSKNDIASVSAKKLADSLNRKGKKALHIPTFEETVDFLKRSVDKGDLVITMGAGPVFQVADEFLKDENRKK